MADTTNLKPIIDLAEEDLDRIIGGAGTGAASGLSVQGTDMEAALMAMQAQRSTLAEAQVQGQMAIVTARSDTIAHLNHAVGSLNAAASSFHTGDSASTQLGAHLTGDAKTQLINSTIDSLKAHGVNVDEQAKDGLTKGEVEGLLSGTQSELHSLSRSQQIDMDRLQYITSRRGEAFDLMTNVDKKMHDARNPLIGPRR